MVDLSLICLPSPNSFYFYLPFLFFIDEKVYDVTIAKTLDDIIALRDELLRTKGREDVPLVLVGNKCDLKV